MLKKIYQNQSHCIDETKKTATHYSLRSRWKRSDADPAAKKVKIQSQESKLNEKLDIFVQSFISSFIKRLAAYYITAKGERLTDESFKAELKTGIISTLADLSIAQIGLGSLPSLVNTIRALSSQYYLPRGRVSRYAHEKFRPSYPRNLFASRDYY